MRAGLEDVLDYLSNLHFSARSIDYLRATNIFSDDFLEYLRGVIFSGFPWHPLAASQYQNPPILQIAEIGGAGLVSGLIVLMNASIALTVVRHIEGIRGRRRLMIHPELMIGLAAVLAESNPREAIAEAIRARRVYATNGPRIFLRVHLDGEPMGSVLRAAPSAAAAPSQYLEIRVAGEGPLRQVDVIRGADIVASFILEGEREWSHAADIPRLEVGEHLYVRALQEDGGTAWSSPLFAR